MRVPLELNLLRAILLLKGSPESEQGWIPFEEGIKIKVEMFSVFAEEKFLKKKEIGKGWVLTEPWTWF